MGVGARPLEDMGVARRESWRGRRVLVTGAGGFVGSWLTHALVEAGADVHVVLRDQPAVSNFSLLGVESRVGVVLGSIADYDLVQRVFNEKEIDSCFHLAAQAIVGAANRSPLSTFESNIKGTWNVLEAARTTSSVQRLVVASSDKAYGPQERLPYTEDAPLLGRSPYEASKSCADLLSASYFHTYGTPVTVTRCANIYGGGDVNMSRLVPGTIRAALEGRRPVIRSDGSPVRDYLHVDDVVDAYLVLGEATGREGVAGKAYNFGTNNPVSVLDLVSMILAAAGSDLQPDVQGKGSLVGEIDRQYIDASRARQELGWEPSVSLDHGLARTVEWYREHLAGISLQQLAELNA